MIAKELFPEAPEERSYDAAQIATDIRNNLLLEGRNFCFETVFSHASKIDFIARAKALGYEVFLVFIHLETVSLNKARISQRVQEGGHNVPEIKIENRIPRLFENIKTANPLCNRVYILDNSSAENPFQLLATIKAGKINILQSRPPHWVQTLLNLESSNIHVPIIREKPGRMKS